MEFMLQDSLIDTLAIVGVIIGVCQIAMSFLMDGNSTLAKLAVKVLPFFAGGLLVCLGLLVLTY